MSKRRAFLMRLVVSSPGLSLLGCASGPAFDPQSLPPLPSGRARLVFYMARSTPIVPMFAHKLQIDDQVGELDAGQYIVFEGAPGLRRIYVRASVDTTGNAMLTFPVDLAAGQVTYARLYRTGGYNQATFYGTVTEALALAQMRGMTRVSMNAGTLMEPAKKKRGAVADALGALPAVASS